MQRFERTFKIWDYRITHLQLLVRSHKTVSHAHNIDIVFGGVEYIELPTILFGLALVTATEEERRRAEALVERPLALDNVFIIETKGRRHLIIAQGMRISENDLDLYQSSLE